MHKSYENFIGAYQNSLSEYWGKVSAEILEWKNEYEWPKNVKLEKAIEIRNSLERSINNDLNKYGHVTKNVFDDIMKWGFGIPTILSDQVINDVTKRAFHELKFDNISKSAKILTEINGIGISRASKVIALSNQDKLGIYDSRAAHGLSDLVFNNIRIIPIPPGRVVAGDYLSKDEYCDAFQNYIHVLKYLHTLVLKDPVLSKYFPRVADIEIALFSRSKKRLKTPKKYQIPKYLNESRELYDSSFEEGEFYWTLGKGNKAKTFWARIEENGIRILTGENGNSAEYLTSTQIKNCLSTFKNKEWFPLGNNITKIEVGGLGEYFRNILHKSAKYASHLAAIWVNQGLLDFRYGERSRIELKFL